MSNVHGFGEDRNPRNRPPVRRNDEERMDSDGNFLEQFSAPVLADQLRIADEKRVLFVSGRKHVKNPQDEHYWDMLSFTLCPTFKVLSLTFLITLADIALFIFEVSVGLDKTAPNLLQVKV